MPCESAYAYWMPGVLPLVTKCRRYVRAGSLIIALFRRPAGPAAAVPRTLRLAPEKPPRLQMARAWARDRIPGRLRIGTRLRFPPECKSAGSGPTAFALQTHAVRRVAAGSLRLPCEPLAPCRAET